DGRLDDIRECIGCNLCYACDGRGVPIRCTQNPAMGEEWRRGGHPERVPAAHAAETALVVGAGPAVVYDDDGYYMASAIAELLAAEGGDVTYVAPAAMVSAWSALTAEQAQVHKRLLELGVKIVTGHSVSAVGGGAVRLACVHTGRDHELPCVNIVPVTSREPEDGLWRELAAGPPRMETLLRIGDCRAPGIIATAVHDGHRAARELGLPACELIERRERSCV
ncbi:MAG: hypothetical protein ACR2PM_11220, partial [Hyphomicrobiales bacterium]